MYYVAFTKPDDVILLYWDNFVEINFWVDILLSFFCEFKDPETNLTERGLKQIALNYLSGWFIVDFVSVFPFNLILSSGYTTKLFRIFRIPRLIKLIDVGKFKSILKSLQSKESNDQTILK